MIKQIITFLFAVTISAQSMAASDTRSIDRFLSKPINSIKSMRSIATPELKPKAKTVRICFIKPPVKFKSIKPVKYICNNNIAKTHARKKMAVSVRESREQKEKLAKERLKKSKQYLARQQVLEEEKRREAEVISIADQNTDKMRNEVSEIMLRMCKKKWADGEHRCYCEPYLKYAPADITQDASCADG